MLLKNKEDIEFHSDNWARESKPAVNVKVYDSLDNGYRKWSGDNPGYDPRFTLDWIEENLSDEQLDNIFWSSCEYRWDDLTWEARAIWDMSHYPGKHGGVKYRVNVYSEGRSGGWAVVDGINTDVESWDAIEFGKWRRFAKFARDTADGIMWDVVDSVYYNYFDEWQLEQSELAAPDLPEGLRA